MIIDQIFVLETEWYMVCWFVPIFQTSNVPTYQLSSIICSHLKLTYNVLYYNI